MDSPIMYYALDVRRVIPSVSPGCGRRPLGRRSFPNVGEKKSSRNPVFAANKNSDWRSRARAYLQSRFTNRGGWVAEMGGCIAGCAHPLEKSAADFGDASIHRLIEETLRRIVRTRDTRD